MKCPHCRRDIKKPPAKKHYVDELGRHTKCGYHLDWYMLDVTTNREECDCEKCLKELTAKPRVMVIDARPR